MADEENAPYPSQAQLDALKSGKPIEDADTADAEKADADTSGKDKGDGKKSVEADKTGGYKTRDTKAGG